MKIRTIFLGLAMAALCAVRQASAAVTPQGWWHYGENAANQRADSSGNNRSWSHAFSCAGSGNEGAAIVPFGVGGPLGNTGFISVNSLYWTPLHCGAAAMWNPANATDPFQGSAEHLYNPPPTNYVIECWCLPEDIASSPGRTWFFASGSGDFTQPSRPSGTGPGGVYFVWDKTAGTGGAPGIGAFVIGNASQGVPTDTQIGDFADVDFTTWMHVAIVNNNGTNTFYVNGVKKGASTALNTIPNGNIFGGGSPGTQPSFHGWLDELRISTFAPGQFSTNDLLLRPAGPNILAQPQSVTVWDGGAAPFSIQVALDTISTYQWQRNGTNIPGANASSVVLSQVFLADNANTVRSVLTGGSITITSAVANLTVVAVNPDNVAAYQNVVKAEPSLLAYFPVDGNTGSTLTNFKDSAHNGLLEPNANYDGRTNRAFGQRSLLFKLDGDVKIPSNPAFDFAGGNGTIEALVYLDQVTPSDATIFSEADGSGSSLGYAIGVSRDGGSLIYTNDAGVGLTWLAPASFIGRFTHVAIVFDHGTNVTAYANGVSLGTKTQAGFGTPGLPAWIGAIGDPNSVQSSFWSGSIDELAIYGSALSETTIAIHNSKFLAGTNQAPATIVTPPLVGSKTLLAGGAPSFTVVAAGTAPLSYQWTTNGVPIPGATQSTLALSHTTTNQSATYGITVSNPYGTNSASFSLTFVAPTDSYAARVMNDNPSAFWRLDETSGTTAFDVAGGHDGTYFGNYASVPPLIPNNPGKAIQFNSPSYTYDATFGARIEVPYSPVFNSGPFSIECFNIAFWDANDGNGALVTSNVRVGSVRQGWILGDGLGDVNYDFILGSGAAQTAVVGTSHAFANVLVHQVGVYDGTNAYLYVNGVLERTINNIGYAPNPSNPLEIGVRNNTFSGTAWNGKIDEVAFYGYALSANQVSNHFSILYVPAAITQQPVGVTNIEGSTITLTAAASGYVNTYQWWKDGSPLTFPTPNNDGTEHFPQNVINPTLVIAQATPSDSGLYRLVVANAVGGSQTLDAKVLITLDTNKPTVVSVAGLGTPNPSGPTPYLVKVLFNKRIDPVAGGDFHNYSIPGATVNGVTLLGDVRMAALGGDWREAIVTTTGLTPGATYNLTVTGVKDQTLTGNTIAPAPLPFKAPVLTQSNLVWDYYYLGSVAGGVGALSGDANYPNAPQAIAYLTAFNSGQITGDDLNNNTTFGALGDNYGCSVSGWITPAVTEDYTFFLWSDDQSELYLSTDANPANATLIAFETGCCHPFTEPPVDYTSAPQHLLAGVPYFIRALQVEGGGGDYVRVAWRASANTNAAASLSPISGDFLSAYKPGPAPLFSPATYNPTTRQLTISWTGTGRLFESTDLVTWTLVPGNPPSPYTVSISTAPTKFYSIRP